MVHRKWTYTVRRVGFDAQDPNIGITCGETLDCSVLYIWYSRYSIITSNHIRYIITSLPGGGCAGSEWLLPGCDMAQHESFSSIVFWCFCYWDASVSFSECFPCSTKGFLAESSSHGSNFAWSFPAANFHPIWRRTSMLSASSKLWSSSGVARVAELNRQLKKSLACWNQ